MRLSRVCTTMIVVFFSVFLVEVATLAQEDAADKSIFTKNTFDLGIVVSDLEQSAKFYTDVVGMTEV